MLVFTRAPSTFFIDRMLSRAAFRRTVTPQVAKAAPPNIERRRSSLDRAVSVLRNPRAEIRNRSIEREENRDSISGGATFTVLLLLSYALKNLREPLGDDSSETHPPHILGSQSLRLAPTSRICSITPCDWPPSTAQFRITARATSSSLQVNGLAPIGGYFTAEELDSPSRFPQGIALC
eukprot:520133-Prorocentrum_minimum.AAC.1